MSDSRKQRRFYLRPAILLWGAGLALGIVSGSLVAVGLVATRL